MCIRDRYRIGAFYRPPGQSPELDVEIVKEIETACHSNEKGIVIMGDFNFPGIHWDSLSNMDRSSSAFINCILDNFLTQMVQEPTRYDALLDLILTNDESMVDEVRVEENLGLSDHNIIRFNMNVISCLLYTSDAADERSSVDLGGRRIIKK